MNAAGFRRYVSEVETILSAVYRIGQEFFFRDDHFYFLKFSTAIKCTITSIGLNFWYLLAAIYYFFAVFGQEEIVENLLNTYYPKVCACNIEADAYVRNIAGFITAGAANSYRCYKEPWNEYSALVDCDTELELLVYDVKSCFESSEWFTCTDDKDGSVTGNDYQKFVSKDPGCSCDDRNEFAHTFHLYLEDGDDFYIEDAETFDDADFADCGDAV